MPRRLGLAQRLVGAMLLPPLIASGCAAHEKMGRPPSLDEIAHINEYAREHGAANVEYVTPLPACAAGACQAILDVRGLPDDISAVVSSDARETVVATPDGRKWNLRTKEVAGVSARDRARGAAVGAAVGAGIGLTLSLLLVALFSGGGPPDAAIQTQKVDSLAPAKAVLAATAVGALGGAPWGLLIGGRRSFDFSVPTSGSTAGGDSSWEP